MVGRAQQRADFLWLKFKEIEGFQPNYLIFFRLRRPEKPRFQDPSQGTVLPLTQPRLHLCLRVYMLFTCYNTYMYMYMCACTCTCTLHRNLESPLCWAVALSPLAGPRRGAPLSGARRARSARALERVAWLCPPPSPPPLLPPSSPSPLPALPGPRAAREETEAASAALPCR